jgi:hypothetical protein
VNAGHFPPDIQEFFRDLQKYKVRYLLVGGEAVIYYGHPRLTGDVDFFYDRSPVNCERLFKALLEFWEKDIPGLKSFEELCDPGVILQFGVPPNRIDLINRIDGVSFQEAWENKESTELTGTDVEIEVHIIGLTQLIKNKEASNRYRDLEDLKYLRQAEAVRKRKSGP